MEENLNNAPNENEQNNAPVDAKVKNLKCTLF